MSALVLGVAGTALAGARAHHAAVVVLVILDVPGDVLVAIQAQGGLRVHIAAVVAQPARFFLFDVSLGDLSGHQQRLYRCGECSRRRQRQRHHPGDPNGTGNFSTSLYTHHLGSVDVDGNHMHDAGDEEHEEQRDVQHMPE
jgi:hypothetical protein